jgi:hypothetical protein
MTTMSRALCSVLAAFGVMGAQAATVYSNDYSSLGALESPGALSATFAAGAGSATLDFEVQGYNTLDGDNYWSDVFHLSVNQQEVFTGTFDLGGGAGGTDRVLLAPTGATAVRGGAQTYEISVPVALVNGSNTITFAYDSPYSFEGAGRAGPQGLGDEGWGITACW